MMLPVKKPRPRVQRLTEIYSFIASKNRIVLEQSAKRWRGMWILPPLRTKPANSLPIHTGVFPFTNHRITLKVFRRRSHELANQRCRWFPKGALNSIPIPSPHRRALNVLLGN